MKKLSAVLIVIMLVALVAVPFAHASPGGILSGKVLETMQSGGYTYVLIENSGGKSWVACPGIKVEVGQTVKFQPGMAMQNFTSKTLGKTFDIIYFTGGLAQ